MVRPTAAGGKGKGFAAVKQNRGVPDDSVVEAQQRTRSGVIATPYTRF